MAQNKQTGSIIIHGGFSDELTDDWDIIENKRMALAQIIQKGYEFLETDAPVVEVASRIIMLIEDNHRTEDRIEMNSRGGVLTFAVPEDTIKYPGLY